MFLPHRFYTYPIYATLLLLVDRPMSQPVRKAGIVIHPHYLRAREALDLVDLACKNHGIELYRVSEDPASCFPDSCQAIVSVGGDGTLLAAVHKAYPSDIPVWGVNVGRLGFLTASGLEEIESGIQALSKGEYTVEYRAMIEGEIRGPSMDPVHMIALNDIVIHRDISRGQVDIEVELDGHFLAMYEGDGLIVSTPTGSTAYALSAGGPILSPELQAILLTPICSHSLSARSLVVSDSRVLTIRPKWQSPGAMTHVTADGRTSFMMKGGMQWGNLEVDGGYTVLVYKSKMKAGLVRLHEVIFSEVLRDKLGWEGTCALTRTT
jgi:NAD+ kinase